ncbi:hypothetical protein TNCV_4743541 [Trichonephila clavipes]|nr:hypothetical protein TNCV_4743541 [Trichonephila clavipes]
MSKNVQEHESLDPVQSEDRMTGRGCQNTNQVLATLINRPKANIPSNPEETARTKRTPVHSRTDDVILHEG